MIALPYLAIELIDNEIREAFFCWPECKYNPLKYKGEGITTLTGLLCAFREQHSEYKLHHFNTKACNNAFWIHYECEMYDD